MHYPVATLVTSVYFVSSGFPVSAAAKARSSRRSFVYRTAALSVIYESALQTSVLPVHSKRSEQVYKNIYQFSVFRLTVCMQYACGAVVRLGFGVSPCFHSPILLNPNPGCWLGATQNTTTILRILTYCSALLNPPV